MKFTAPIPGMSLTRKPGNAPYEQPPLYNTPEDALGFYFQKLDDEDNLDDILFALDSGVPLESLVNAMTSVGVMEGYHSVDAKLLISPALHEYLASLADAAGIEYREEAGPTKDEKRAKKEKQRLKFLMQKALEEDTPVSEENAEKAEDALGQQEPTEDVLGTPEAEEMPLVPRRMK